MSSLGDLICIGAIGMNHFGPQAVTFVERLYTSLFRGPTLYCTHKGGVQQ